MQQLEPRIEELDIALRKVDKLGKCWRDRLTIENFRLVERYFKGELVFLLKLRPKWPADAEEFFAVLDCSLRHPGDDPLHWRNTLDTGSPDICRGEESSRCFARLHLNSALLLRSLRGRQFLRGLKMLLKGG